MNRIRYKYTKGKEGFQLAKVKCPVCGGQINWIKIAQDKSWDGKIILLAECWSGNTGEDKPQHLFLIELENLPTVNINKIKKKVKKK